MPTLSDVLERGGLTGLDNEWLHLLVGDWQLVSDLSFADLVLWVAGPRPGSWVVAAHVRPNTGPLVFYDDLVGSEADGERAVLLDESAGARELVRDRRTWQDDESARVEAVPVVRDGRVLGVLTRHSMLATMRMPSRLELTYRATADVLLGMVAAGEFPTAGWPTGARRGAPRVGDGVVILDVDGVVTYASPNATSGLHRLGHQREIVGDYLSRVTTDLIEDRTVVDESLALVVTGRAPWRTEIESRTASLSLRAVPLVEEGARTGALVLMRDVTELRRRERELLTKDATIREIHHRVKNNLQTVAALLRLQSRRVEDDGAQAALQEAGRRVATIALVHDMLSRTLDAAVDFDEIVTRALNAVVEVATQGPRVTWRLEGSFGHLGAEDATSIALVVTELVQNAVEHALAQDGGTVVVEAHRDPDEPELTVVVADDGVGLPEGFRPGSGGLGTRIVEAFVQDLKGTIAWESPEAGGTRVRFVARLRTPRGADGLPADDEGGR